MSKRSELGKLIVAECVKNDWTQIQLAKELGMSVAFLSAVIKGRKSLPYARATHLLSILKGIDHYAFWNAYFGAFMKLKLSDLPEKKKQLVASILAAELSDSVIESLQEAIDKVS